MASVAEATGAKMVLRQSHRLTVSSSTAAGATLQGSITEADGLDNPVYMCAACLNVCAE